MIFPRLIWSSLAVALAVGTVQTGVQRLQAEPLIAAAEAYEEQRDQKAEAPALVAAPVAPVQAVAAHTHDDKHDHNNGMAKQWEPANGAERTGWTWVANALHAFSMALLVLAVMGVWRFQRGGMLTALQLSGFVAAAGWLSFYLWPALGLPATVPGMEAAPLHARQLWSVLAVPPQPAPWQRLARPNGAGPQSLFCWRFRLSWDHRTFKAMPWLATAHRLTPQ